LNSSGLFAWFWWFFSVLPEKCLKFVLLFLVLPKSLFIRIFSYRRYKTSAVGKAIINYIFYNSMSTHIGPSVQYIAHSVLNLLRQVMSTKGVRVGRVGQLSWVHILGLRGLHLLKYRY
jgi:hypothetical protein